MNIAYGPFALASNYEWVLSGTVLAPTEPALWLIILLKLKINYALLVNEDSSEFLIFLGVDVILNWHCDPDLRLDVDLLHRELDSSDFQNITLLNLVINLLISLLQTSDHQIHLVVVVQIVNVSWDASFKAYLV